jgi:trimethylamine:corrinoid methyltransferase-like protein
MIDESPTTRPRQRGVRARRQRDARRTHALIAGIERQIPAYELLGEEALFRMEAAAEGMKDAPARAAERCKRLLVEYERPKLDLAISEELADFVRRRKSERPNQWR